MISDLTIIKIGGSAVTDKTSPEGKARPEELERIAEEISGYDRPLIIVHGAGSYGHTYAKKYGLDKGFDAEGVMVTHDSVRQLNDLVVSTLRKHGIRAMPLNPFAFAVCENGRISSFLTDQITLMLENGLVPVLHGDVAMDSERGACIISGDQSLPYLAKALRAKRAGLGSAADGVLDGDGKVIPRITPETFGRFARYIGSSAGTDVTGGMLGKVKEILDLADSTGIDACIFNANEPGNYRRYLEGEDIGTIISRC